MVEFYQQGITSFLFNRSGNPNRVGHQKVITNDLQTVSVPCGEVLPAFPIILGESVFDGNDGILFNPIGPEIHHLVAGQFTTFFAKVVEFGVFFIKLGGCRVECNCHIFTSSIASFLNSFEDQFHGFIVGFQGRSKPTFIADEGAIPMGFENAF